MESAAVGEVDAEHAMRMELVYTMFDLAIHPVGGRTTIVVGDGDGGQRVTSSTVARLLAIMVLLTPLRRFLNVNEDGFMQFASSKSMMHSMSSQQLIHGEPTSLGSA